MIRKMYTYRLMISMSWNKSSQKKKKWHFISLGNLIVDKSVPISSFSWNIWKRARASVTIFGYL